MNVYSAYSLLIFSSQSKLEFVAYLWYLSKMTKIWILNQIRWKKTVRSHVDWCTKNKRMFRILRMVYF
jgi:hypothetical protein